MRKSKNIQDFILISVKYNFIIAFFFFLWKIWFKIKDVFKNNRISDYFDRTLNSISEFLFLDSHKSNFKELTNVYQICYQGKEYFIRERTSDYAVFNQIIIQKSYLHLADIFKRSFKSPPNLIFDLGSNVGYSAMFFNEVFGDKCKINCYEPFHSNFNLLKDNISLNNMNNVHAFNFAIWSESTYLKFNRNFRDNQEWSISIEPGTENNFDVKGLSISELIKNETCIDILKIDIEGSEKKLFENPKISIQFLAKVKCICIEIHDEFNCRDLIYAQLGEANFVYYEYSDLTIGLNKNYL
jgi:FkbM family methyltransferase